MRETSRSLHEEALATLDRALSAVGHERQTLMEHALFLHRLAVESDEVAAGHANNNDPPLGRRRA